MEELVTLNNGLTATAREIANQPSHYASLLPVGYKAPTTGLGNLFTDDPNSGIIDTWGRRGTITDGKVQNMFGTADAGLQDYIAQGDYEAYKAFAGTDAMDPAAFTTATTDANTTDWSMDGLGGTLMGVGQMGLGVMSFLDSQKTNKLNRELTQQQIASNTTTMANRAADRASTIAAFRG